MPPSCYKAISCHIPATPRLTTTNSHKNKVEDQPLLQISWHPQGYNFKALCRIWEGTVAYGAEVALPSPVRKYDSKVALGESALHIVRPTPLCLSIYSPVIRADWRKNIWSGSQVCISCQLPQYRPCLSVSCTCISGRQSNSSVETSARRMSTMSETGSRRARFLEGSSLSRRRYVAFRSLVFSIAHPRCDSCGTCSMPQKTSKKAQTNRCLAPGPRA